MCSTLDSIMTSIGLLENEINKLDWNLPIITHKRDLLTLLSQALLFLRHTGICCDSWRKRKMKPFRKKVWTSVAISSPRVKEKSQKNLLWFVVPWRNHLILYSWFYVEQRHSVIYLVCFDQNTAKSAWQCPFKSHAFGFKPIML